MNSVVTTTLRANTRQFVQDFNMAQRAVTNVVSTAGLLKRPMDMLVGKIRSMGKQLMMWGLGADASFATAVWAASSFEDKMANVNSVLQLSTRELRSYSNEVVDLSLRLPQSANDLATGLYDIVSSGFEGEQALQVLDAAGRSAAAGLTTTQNASQAIVGSLNAYGQSAIQAAATSDILFQTVNLGVLSFEELTQGMGTWIGLAANAGVPLDEASAALATMTLSGIQADEASTALARTMQAFIKPSEEMTNVVSELGYSSAFAMLQQEGLHGAMEKIREATGADTVEMARLFLEVRGLNGALALTANNGRQYTRVWEQMTDAEGRAGSTQRAFAEQSETLSAAMKRWRNVMTGIAIDIGSRLLPILTNAVNIGTSFTMMWKNIPSPIRQAIVLVGAFGGALMTIIGYLAMTRTTAWATMKALSMLSSVKWLNFLSPMKLGVSVGTKLSVVLGRITQALWGLIPAQVTAKLAETWTSFVNLFASGGAVQRALLGIGNAAGWLGNKLVWLTGHLALVGATLAVAAAA